MNGTTIDGAIWYQFNLYLTINPPPSANETNVNINITEPWAQFYTENNGRYNNFTMSPPSDAQLEELYFEKTKNK